MIVKYFLNIENNNWCVIYKNHFPINCEIKLDFTKIDDYNTSVQFFIKTEIPDKYYTDNYINFGKMMRPFMLDNYITLIENNYSKS